MISRFQTALRFSLRERGNVVLERWDADGTLRDAVSVEHETSTERIPIAPDAFFTLRFLNEPDGRNRVHVFLEADRGTMTVKRFFTKLRGYWAWWRSGRQERLGIKSFQVLTITRTPERAASLFDAATRAMLYWLCRSATYYAGQLGGHSRFPTRRAEGSCGTRGDSSIT